MCRTTCTPYFVGVWDTVSSVGWKDNPLKLPFSADNPDIAIGRHAIAIDERRAFFRTNRWVPSALLNEHGPRDVKQVWFAGVHCDVGGGYAEAESGLSKIALEWMLEEAKANGLLVNDARQAEVLGLSPGSTYAKPDADACQHESLQGAWKIAEWIRSRITTGRPGNHDHAAEPWEDGGPSRRILSCTSRCSNATAVNTRTPPAFRRMPYRLRPCLQPFQGGSLRGCRLTARKPRRQSRKNSTARGIEFNLLGIHGLYRQELALFP